MERLKVNEYLGSWHKGLPLAIKESFTDEDGLKVVAEQTFIGSELSKKCPVHEVSQRDVVERSKIDKAIAEIEELKMYFVYSHEDLISKKKVIEIIKRNIRE